MKQHDVSPSPPGFKHCTLLGVIKVGLRKLDNVRCLDYTKGFDLKNPVVGPDILRH